MMLWSSSPSYNIDTNDKTTNSKGSVSDICKDKEKDKDKSLDKDKDKDNHHVIMQQDQ